MSCASLCGQCLSPHESACAQSHETFLPPNITPHLQRTDLGIVRSVTLQHRTRLAEHLLFDRQQDRATVTDMSFAIQVISAIWNGLRSEVVRNCSRKGGLNCGDMVEEEPHMEDPKKDSLENEAWTCIQETADVLES
ncbi:hypothetical protein HPB48_021052 [Haemaphysalis longicornis]|uniref:Uncharacterized protein n=1 Tax=Haemaphysalis longicornis TaxID=44386 RepID=A0A9J6FRC9_HAELO|nr:hypothetical protein HPB48_021052 [Haemaphysalis longicornis]